MNPSSTILHLWNWQSPMLLVAAAMTALYFWSHRGRITARAWFFVAAMGFFLLAMISPLNRLANGYLFSAHMVHHLLLLLIVPGLLLLSISPAVTADLLRNRVASALVWFFSIPLIGWAMGTGAMWLWHVPTFCVASQTSVSVSNFQTVSLLLMGASFWLPICSPDPARRLTGLRGVAYLFAGCVACTGLGIYLTFSPVSVCPSFVSAADPLGIMPYLRNNLGLTPAVDQQIGGLLMWVPACLIYMIGVFALLLRWYGRPNAVETNNVDLAAVRNN